MRWPVLVPMVMSAMACSVFCAKPQAWLNPEEAGPEYRVQGEYVGENCGAQVVALGEGRFWIMGWSKGLPGTVEGAEKKVRVEAKQEGEKVVFDGEGWKGALADGVLVATGQEGKTVRLERVERASPTLGRKAPEGAVVLFDGSNADAWEGGRMDARRLLYCGTKSKQVFGDMQLHVEFRTPFMPGARGQGRGNSGVYVQNRYECQVLDSFGLEGAYNETGGIYSISKPLLNMCLPPLAWQTYDIDFEAARFDAEGKKVKNALMTVRLNGVLVQDRVEVPQPTAASGLREGVEKGPIYLQDHGDPVFFRNIWVLEKK